MKFNWIAIAVSAKKDCFIQIDGLRHKRRPLVIAASASRRVTCRHAITRHTRNMDVTAPRIPSLPETNRDDLSNQAAKNIDVNTINFTIQNRIHGETTTYKSIGTVVNQDEVVNYPTEFLNSIDLPGIPPHVLTLKIGVSIILLRNINPPRLCNGIRLSVKKMMNKVIEATILIEKFKDEDVLLPRIPMIPTDMPFEFKRLMFPLRLVFAMTINKARGQSLQVCGLNLENPCFSHGQLYVACSRVGKPSDLFVYASNGKQEILCIAQHFNKHRIETKRCNFTIVVYSNGPLDDIKTQLDPVAQQSLALLQIAFDNGVPCKMTIYSWFLEFKRGRLNLSDEFCDGLPFTAVKNKNAEAVRHIIETDRHVTYHQHSRIFRHRYTALAVRHVKRAMYLFDVVDRRSRKLARSGSGGMAFLIRHSRQLLTMDLVMGRNFKTQKVVVSRLRPSLLLRAVVVDAVTLGITSCKDDHRLTQRARVDQP
ncbi:ATP-dependent DNA helicase PIF6 [Eumeta japonica]|uniref:ATP-dependent DNA helicase PIF6 n=1 Tax=Eumeta variegata TaxID=151549 RepID=A0A4C2A7J1_EUMVA|nr:ATP-dependent DNA helicase PIF6 [Eumeta japonica]